MAQVIKTKSNCDFRYDRESDYVQILFDPDNETWLNWQKAYLQVAWLIKDGLNYGNISTNGIGSISYADELTTLSVTSTPSSHPNGGNSKFVFDEIDFTNYDRIVFKQKTNIDRQSTQVVYIKFFIEDDLGNVLTTFEHVPYYNTSNPIYTLNDDIILDVSNLSGKYKICITLGAYNGTTTCQLSQVYAE